MNPLLRKIFVHPASFLSMTNSEPSAMGDHPNAMPLRFRGRAHAIPVAQKTSGTVFICRAFAACRLLFAGCCLLLATFCVISTVSPANLLGQEATSTAQAPAAGTPQSNPLVDMLKSPNESTRAKAAQELGKSADVTAVPALISALSDPSIKVRREVVTALASIGSFDTLNGLVTASRDPDSDVRVLAIDGLVGHYTGQSPRTGFIGFVKKSYSRAKSRFEADDTRIDPGAQVDPNVITAVVATMNDTRVIRPSREAARALGVLVARSAVPDLVKAAHTNDEDLVREALNALAKINDTSAGPQIADLLDSRDQYVKRDAALAVGVLKTTSAVPKLQTMFQNDTDEKNKQAALQALAYIGDPVSDPIFIKALWSENKKYRALGAEGLALAHDDQALPEIEKALSGEKDASATLAMNYALAALGKYESVPALVDELDSMLRGDTAQTYLIQLSRDPQVLPKLYPYLDSQDSTVRKRLCTVLMYTGNQTSLEPLQRLAHDKDNNVAIEALRALRAIRARTANS